MALHITVHTHTHTQQKVTVPLKKKKKKEVFFYLFIAVLYRHKADDSHCTVAATIEDAVFCVPATVLQSSRPIVNVFVRYEETLPLKLAY
jgi:hypothetical protein